MVLRKRVIGTRFCVRSPLATEGAAELAEAALLLPAATNFSTSSLVTRPFLPEPLILLASKPFSEIILRTDGLNASSLLSSDLLSDWASDFALSLAAALSSLLAEASSFFAAGAPPSSILPITSSAVTVAPVSWIISPITPSAWATTSSTTLSVSISTNTWSRVTASPVLTCQVAMVASATDSGSTGTLISTFSPFTG